MKEIALTNGFVALVDDDDFERLNAHKWYARPSKCTHYAVRNSPRGLGKKPAILMHREVLLVSGWVDHRDGAGLNNQKVNLRAVSRAQNTYNKRKIYGSSRFKGVGFYKSKGKWHARIQHLGVQYHIGYFREEYDAAQAYNMKAEELFGEFAYFNTAGTERYDAN